MEGEERELSVEEIRNRDLSPEQVFNGMPGSDSSRSFSCGNILEIVKHCVAYKCRRVRAQPQSNSLNGEEGAEQDDFGYRKAHCFSSYYTVFVARLAIMEGGKTESGHPKGKDKDELTAVPSKGDRVQTRSKRTNPGKEAEIPARSIKGKK